ncbi:hypothetical protein [Vibrio europaeus]|uniref:hypothetical protein n=1 Tax=Vibrio europaeus TaxID=300876 RepID=UPI00233E5D57|nr:hypothetical protein [Vibrio europaeus]MDC5822244.1 hypothetical protein [Vibrio europaeus]MDC5853627.1 hypothetical protein [Vibrio europaeus]
MATPTHTAVERPGDDGKKASQRLCEIVRVTGVLVCRTVLSFLADPQLPLRSSSAQGFMRGSGC